MEAVQIMQYVQQIKTKIKMTFHLLIGANHVEEQGRLKADITAREKANKQINKSSTV